MKNTLLKNAVRVLALSAMLFSFATLQAQAPTEKQLQEIEKIMAPAREKLIKYLEADKTGQYKTYLADMEAASKEQDVKRKTELLTRLEKNHIAFIRKAYKAVINHEEQYRAVVKILGHTKFTYGEFGQIQIDFTTPAVALPVRFDETFTCPMEVTESSSNNQAAADCHGSAGDCSYRAFTLAEIAGGCRSTASSGDKFELPEGTFTKITVAAQSDISYDGFVFAMGGYGQINGKFGIRFQAPGIDKITYTKEVFALAPLLWFARLKGEANDYISQASFTGTFTQGTTVTAQAYVESFAISVPVFALQDFSAGSSNIDSIKIDGSN